MKRSIKTDQSKFILCPRNKGLSRKHVDICHGCRNRKRCRSFKAYVQPFLPLEFFTKAH